MASDQNFEVLESSEAFVEKDGDLVFDSTKIIFKQGDDYFSARLPTRQPSSITMADLDRARKTLIPAENIWPPFEPGLTIMSEPLTTEHFCKQPSLLHYGDTEASLNPARELVKEARICELLKQRPHPNIAAYFGAAVQGGRIKGLVFQKYAMTLSRRLRTQNPLDGDGCLRSIEEGVRHLHSMGLVHNDLNPNNIMVNDDDHVVIIDFDSCEKEGSELGPKSCTPGWAPTSRIASKDNDNVNLSKLQAMITGSTSSNM